MQDIVFDFNRQVGIQRLLSKGTYSAAYPLHDGRYDKDGPNGEKCARRVSSSIRQIKTEVVFLFLIIPIDLMYK